MGIDPTGHLPKWAAWLISGVAIIGGIVLCATGIGGIAGGALIGAGAGSLIGGYVNEAAGGSFEAGYVGGAISGALTGLGAGAGSLSFISASYSSGLACMADLFAGVTYSFAGGFIGNMLNESYLSAFDKNTNDPLLKIGKSSIAGAINVLAGLGSATSSMFAKPLDHGIIIGSKSSKVMAGAISGAIEAIYDGVSTLISWIISKF